MATSQTAGEPVTTLTDLPLMLTVEETARVLRIGRNRAYEAVSQGSIPSIRIGRKIRVPRKALAEWIGEDLEQQPPGQAPSVSHSLDGADASRNVTYTEQAR